MNKEALDAVMEKAQKIAQNWPACMRDQRVGYPSERHRIRGMETQNLWRKSEMTKDLCYTCLFRAKLVGVEPCRSCTDHSNWKPIRPLPDKKESKMKKVCQRCGQIMQGSGYVGLEDVKLNVDRMRRNNTVRVQLEDPRRKRCIQWEGTAEQAEEIGWALIAAAHNSGEGE